MSEYEVNLEINTKDLMNQVGILGEIGDDVDQQLRMELDDIMFNYLDELKNVAIANANWESQSGRLVRSHEIVETEDGWALKVDPTEYGADVNYAARLEFGLDPRYNEDFSWIIPTHESMKSKLIGRTRKALAKAAGRVVKRKLKESITRIFSR